jgi:hypothetical protein
MQTRRRVLGGVGLVALAAALVAGFWYWTRPPEPETPPLALGSTGDATGFTRALEPRTFSFPRDHGPHRRRRSAPRPSAPTRSTSRISR